MHHPEALPPDCYTLTSASDDIVASVVEEFNSITPETPLTPVMITDGEVVPPKQTPSSAGSSGRTIISKYLVQTQPLLESDVNLSHVPGC